MAAAGVLGVVLGLLPGRAHAAPDPAKVLHIAFDASDDGFDAIKSTNFFTGWVADALFERLLSYDYLARPAKLVPQAAEALPEVSEGGRVYTFKIRKGILFAPDAVFQGRPRELTAEDFVYTFKRTQDPSLRAQSAGFLAGKIVGLDALAARARQTGRFDDAAPVAGLRALDRYTLRVELIAPDYTFPYLAAYVGFGAQAREVVQAYGEQVSLHPVGTGPYRLSAYVPRSKIVLEANPHYRGFVWNFEPMPGDAWDAQLVKDMRGKTMPRIGRVEIAIIEEDQARQLALEARQTDVDKMVQSAAPRILDGIALNAAWQAQGVRMQRFVEPEITYEFMNLGDPVLGGMGKDKIALRRAIALSYRLDDEIRIIRHNQAKAAHMLVPEGVQGHDPSYRSSNRYNPALAEKLLDEFGYRKGADGWRTLPDGRPLVVTIDGQSNSPGPEYAELWKRSLNAVGLQTQHRLRLFADNLKEAKACRLPMWGAAWPADFPEGENFVQLLYGPHSSISNMACYRSEAYDALYRKAVALPLGPERFALYKQMTRQMEADTPWVMQVSRIRNWLVYPWVQGFKRHPILRAEWAYMDLAERPGR